MKTTEPWFMEWVIITRGGWKLKKNAPKEVVIAFNEYIKQINRINIATKN